MKLYTKGLAVAVTLISFLSGVSHANIITIERYRCGEDDPNSRADETLNGNSYLAADSGPNGNHLTKFIGKMPSWSADTPPGYQLKLESSTLSYKFTGEGHLANCLKTKLATTLTDTFGVEFWLKPDSSNVNEAPLANGWSDNGGFSFRHQKGNYGAHLMGVNFICRVPEPSLGWTHLAMVVDMKAWGETRFYVNGRLADATPFAPIAPREGEYFTIGGYGTAGAVPFHGLIDEIRVFSFESGQFEASDLNYQVPEPGGVALLIPTACVLLGAVRQAIRQKGPGRPKAANVRP